MVPTYLLSKVNFFFLEIVKYKSKTMILCVGTLGSGKSALLQALKQYGQECTMATDEYPMDMTKEMEIPYTTPTAGSKD